MAMAAVPNYLAKCDFSTASPGSRFGMFLELWGVDSRSGELLWSTKDVNYRVKGKEQRERSFGDENKNDALKKVITLTPSDRALLDALGARQSQIATVAGQGGNLLRMQGLSVAPFTTGLGNEHPLENGFAFLNPYGLPYLPGSGVKGVMRRAARELASGQWGDDGGWATDERYPLVVAGKPVHDATGQPIWLDLCDVLLGREVPGGDSNQFRGALTFWDVFPEVAGDRLAVEIMTPHQRHYYQKDRNPHESGEPNPISFLSVPAQSGFVFHVLCNVPRLQALAPGLVCDDQWKRLLSRAFEHAFEWCGFGAKTSVGYGAMAVDVRRQRREQEEAAKARAEALQAEREQQRLSSLSPLELEIDEITQSGDSSKAGYLKIIEALESARWASSSDIQQVASWVRQKMIDEKAWKETSEKKNPKKDKEHLRTLVVMKYLE